jgi:hypothetical protein
MFKKIKGKLVAVGSGLSMALVASPAFATTSSFPDTLEGLQAFAEAKGEVAMALVILVTCIVLAIKFAKIPRRA